MTEFDHEIIAALAEGRLPAAEAADVEARIAADPVASAELEAQRVALAALAAAPAPALDDLERRRLHRSIADELDIVLPAAGPVAKPRRFNVNWAALATTAAVLLTVALAAPVLRLLNTSDDGAADTTTEVAAAATTSVDSAAAAADPAGEDAAEPQSDELAAAEIPAATEAPEAEDAGETTSVLEDAPEAALDGFFAYARETLPNLGELEGDLTQALARRLSEPAVPFSADRDVADFPCAEQLTAELESRSLDPATTATEVIALAVREGTTVYVVQLGDAEDGRELVLLSADDCAVVGAAVVE